MCVCVRERFRIHSSIFNVSCCTSVAMYQNAVTWHALLYIKKRKEKKKKNKLQVVQCFCTSAG